MIYPTLHFNYHNSGSTVIKLVDTDLPDEEATLFCFALGNDQGTASVFMNLLSTFIAQAEIFCEKGWCEDFDDDLEFNDNEDENDEK